MPQSSGEQRVWIKMPRRQRIEHVMDGRREVRIVDGDRAWIRTADGKVREVPAERGRDRTHLLVPFRRSAADVLAEWRSVGVRDDVSHVARLGGREVTVIGAKLGERNTPAVWLDAERGVVRMVVREKLPRGEGMVDLTYSEHQPLAGGLQFPYRQEVFVDGKLALLIVVRSLAVNTGLSDALFDPGRASPRSVTAARVAFLGTSAALTSAARDNTSLVFEASGTAVLADCGGGALHRLRRLGVDPLALTHVIVTHLHVDHAYGLPALVRELMMLGRQAPLSVVCRPEHVEPLRALLTMFRAWERPDAFALRLTPVDLAVGAPAFTSGQLRVSTAPNDHGPMPNFAVRVDVDGGGAAGLFLRHAAERRRGGAGPRSRDAGSRGDLHGARPSARPRQRPLQRRRRRPDRGPRRGAASDPDACRRRLPRRRRGARRRGAPALRRRRPGGGGARLLLFLSAREPAGSARPPWAR